MADINHEIKINAAPQAVYQALTTASELAKWHTAGTNGKDDTFTTHPAEGPSFEWRFSNPMLTRSNGNASQDPATPSAPPRASSCHPAMVDKP